MTASEKNLFEKRSVLSAVLSLALPSIMGQIVLVIYNMADTLFIGMTCSDALIASVTVCTPAFMFLSAISNLFGIGGSSVMARALGSNNEKKAVDTSTFAIWCCTGITVIYCLLALIFKDTFINILGGSNPDVHRYSSQYMLIAIILGGLPTSLNTLFSHLIRGSGHSIQASIGITMGGILNIVLDPILMFVVLPEGNEMLGAAIATAFSNFCAFIYYCIIIMKNRSLYHISIKPGKDCLAESIPCDVLMTGAPACIMTLCENISYAVLDNLMCAFGTAAQAGIGVAKKINMLAHCFARGMSQGVLPLIAYNYSCGKAKRMKAVVKVTICISVSIACLCTLICFTCSTSLVSIFIRSEMDSLTLGASFLKILCIGAPFSALAYTIISFFQATGHGIRSLILALMRKGIIDIPLMYLLGNIIPTYGIVLATPLADILCCIVAVAMYLIFTKEFSLSCSCQTVRSFS